MYNNLITAFNHMLADQGLPRATNLPEIEATPGWLAIADSALGSLTPKELEDLSVGDHDSWQPIFSKLGKDAEITHIVLDAIFENCGF